MGNVIRTLLKWGIDPRSDDILKPIESSSQGGNVELRGDLRIEELDRKGEDRSRDVLGRDRSPDQVLMVHPTQGHLVMRHARRERKGVQPPVWGFVLAVEGEWG